MRSPVEDRGSSCRKTSRSCQRGTSFSIPMIVIKVSGKVRHPAVALGFDNSQRSGLGDPEVGAADGHLGGKNLRRRC